MFRSLFSHTDCNRTPIIVVYTRVGKNIAHFVGRFQIVIFAMSVDLANIGTGYIDKEYFIEEVVMQVAVCKLELLEHGRRKSIIPDNLFDRHASG